MSKNKLARDPQVEPLAAAVAAEPLAEPLPAGLLAAEPLAEAPVVLEPLAEALAGPHEARVLAGASCGPSLYMLVPPSATSFPRP